MTLHATGYRAMCETIASETDVLDFLTGLIECRGTAAAGLFDGASECLQNVYLNIRNAGWYIPTVENQELDTFLRDTPSTMKAKLTQSLTLGHKIAGEQLYALAAVVQHHRKVVSFEERPAPTVAPAPTEPMRVEIVSMPTRVKSTEIDHDAKGQITDARQYERDAA